MSVLETPRLYFIGKCTWDPIVTNNSANYWDIETSKPDQPLTSAAAYREKIDNEIASSGNWNPHGTHRSVFYETFATAFDSGSGRATGDAIVNVPVTLQAMLVDMDPYVANTSQLFFDELKIGIDGGPQIRMPNNGPMVGRYINFGRNNSLEIAGHASVIWQTTCVDGLQIHPFDSALLHAFQAAIDSGDATGLTIRINAYRTIYFNSRPPTGNRYQGLEDRVKGGGFQPNPARSLIVGVVGLHRDGEPRSLPADRQLSGGLGTAFARRSGQRLVIDLANSVPETDFEANKQDLGDISITAGGQPLGTLALADYDKAAYEATAGLVSIELSPSQAAAVDGGELALASRAGPSLSEQPLTAVIDPPNIYVEGADSKSVRVQVLRHGKPVAAKIKIQVAEAARNPLKRDPATRRPVPPIQLETVETDDSGRIELEFSSRPDAEKFRVFDGSSQWVFTPFEGAEPSAPTAVDPSTDCYLAVRVTPADDDIAALEPTWENVHQRVLIDWEALAPCMDNWLKLGDEHQCRSMAPLLKQLTSLGHFNSYTYMPVTRGLTKGQRTLLHNWCDSPAPSEPAPAAGRAAGAARRAVARPDEPVDLSRGFSKFDDSTLK